MTLIKTHFTLLLIILFVACTGQIASDIYAPSIPAISAYFHSSLTDVKFSMAIFMLGLSCSQLVYGPLSDAFGRKKPLMVGLMILIIGHVISLTSTQINALIFGRFVQGLGAGATATLWRSIFRDTFQGAELARFGAYFSILITFMVPASPALGGFLAHYYNWQANFIFLIGYALLTLVLVSIYFKETSQHHHLERLRLRFVLHAYKQIFSNRIFMGYTFCTFLCYGAFFSWFAVGPILLIQNLGLNPIQFGWVTLFGGGIMTALGGWLTGRLVSSWGATLMLRIGFSIMFLAGMSLLIGFYCWRLNAIAIIVPMLLFYFGLTFIWPNAFANAFQPFGKTAGYAGAVYGFVQVSGAAVIGTLVAYLPDENQLPLALVFIGASSGALLIFECFIRKHEKTI